MPSRRINTRASSVTRGQTAPANSHQEAPVQRGNEAQPEPASRPQQTHDEFVTPPQPLISLPPSIRRNIFQVNNRLENRRVGRYSADSDGNDADVNDVGVNTGPHARTEWMMSPDKNKMTLPSVIEEDSTILATPATLTTRRGIDDQTPAGDDELVARDLSGKYNVPAEPLLAIAGDGSAALEDFQGEPMHIMTDKEGIEIEIAEMMSKYRNRELSDERLRLYDLVRQSLHDTVASVDEDNWMYGVEEDCHI